MKRSHLLLSILLCAGLVLAHPASNTYGFYGSTKASMTVRSQGGNSISGNVFGEARHPVQDTYVELLDEVYTAVARTRTTSTGFYSFSNLTQGTFKVRVLPYGTDYAEQTQEVAIQNISILEGHGHDSAHLDFYLKLKPNINGGPFSVPGAVFAQDVPQDAQKMYQQGIGELRVKKDKEGFESLKRAIETFPQYYLAIDRLGTEYVARGFYEPGYILLTKAVEINPRGFSSVFGLGVAQYHLKRIDEAIVNLRNATTLYNKSINAVMWLGVALKKAGKLDQAEASLKQANQLAKGKEPEVHWQLARLYGEQNRYKEAADSLEMFLKTQPDTKDPEKIRQLIKQLRAKESKVQ